MKLTFCKRILVISIVFIIVFSVFGVGTLADKSLDVTAGLTELEKAQGYRFIGEDGNLKLFLDTKTTNFYIEDSETGIKTFAFPENVEAKVLILVSLSSI